MKNYNQQAKLLKSLMAVKLKRITNYQQSHVNQYGYIYCTFIFVLFITPTILQIYIKMLEIAKFEKRLKLSSDFMKKQSINQSLEILKSLQRDLRDYLNIYQIEDCDQLSQMQIAIYNNLACLYEKKGKYKSSLYHLEIAQKLENNLFVHKYHDEAIPIHAILKIATTYSNLSAIHCKLGNKTQALRNVQFAIKLFKRHHEISQHKHLMFLFYNYATLLYSTTKYSQSSAYSLEGLKLAKQYEDNQMTQRYQGLLQVLRDKLIKVEIKKQNKIKKYVTGQMGVKKNINNLFQANHNNTFIQQSKEFESLHKEVLLDFQINSRFSPKAKNKFLGRQKTVQYNKRRFLSTQASFKRQHSKSSSTHTDKFLDALPGSKPNTKTQQPQIIENDKNFEEEKRNTAIDVYKIVTSKDKRFCKTKRQNRIDARIKGSNCILERQIFNLNKKNSRLEKIIQKMHLSKK